MEHIHFPKWRKWKATAQIRKLQEDAESYFKSGWKNLRLTFLILLFNQQHSITVRNRKDKQEVSFNTNYKAVRNFSFSLLVLTVNDVLTSESKLNKPTVSSYLEMHYSWKRHQEPAVIRNWCHLILNTLKIWQLPIFRKLSTRHQTTPLTSFINSRFKTSHLYY